MQEFNRTEDRSTAIRQFGKFSRLQRERVRLDSDRDEMAIVPAVCTTWPARRVVSAEDLCRWKARRIS
ncbi:hypothetical protein K0M31_018392 [Melipona bicolor]|uniref:Uncharacterized protein n=1 Tax=Melipona bicolor TaxID=60889 RepID=A0AA40KRN0_9HYME|nr:hypothetical protein K0M31_018392 [Melipona bicolor]